MSDHGMDLPYLGEWHGSRMQTESLRQQEATERLRPFFLVSPRLFQDGNAWCALHGEHIGNGVVGWGDSPDEASRAFDVAWTKKVPSSLSEPSASEEPNT